MHAPTVSTLRHAPDGRAATLYTLEVPGGWRATVTDYGAILRACTCPRGTVRRHAGRRGARLRRARRLPRRDIPISARPAAAVANRIAGGTFDLDGRPYTLATNNGPTTCTAASSGFDKKLWQATPRLSDRGPAVDFEMVSPDGDEGYPGRSRRAVTYTLTPDGELWVEMTATTDAPTVINLVHHSYWNLAATPRASIRGHELAVAADAPARRRRRHPDRRTRAGGRHAVRLPARAEAAAAAAATAIDGPAGRARTETRGGRRQQLRGPRLAARRQPADRGDAPRPDERPDARSALRPAGHPGLHGELPRRHADGQGGRGLRRQRRRSASRRRNIPTASTTRNGRPPARSRARRTGTQWSTGSAPARRTGFGLSMWGKRLASSQLARAASGSPYPVAGRSLRPIPGSAHSECSRPRRHPWLRWSHTPAPGTRGARSLLNWKGEAGAARALERAMEADAAMDGESEADMQ